MVASMLDGLAAHPSSEASLGVTRDGHGPKNIVVTLLAYVKGKMD